MSTDASEQMEARAEAWEDGDYIVVIGPMGEKSWDWGTPIGRTLSKREAEIVVSWLNTGALSEVIRRLRAAIDAAKEEERGG